MTAKTLRIFFRERHRAAAAFDRGADRDDPRHARRGGTVEDGVEIVGEIGKIEMRVGVDQHPRTYHWMTELAHVSPPPKTTSRT